MLVLARAVAAGHGVAVLPLLSVADEVAGVEVRPLREPRLERRLTAVVRGSVSAPADGRGRPRRARAGSDRNRRIGHPGARESTIVAAVADPSPFRLDYGERHACNFPSVVSTLFRFWSLEGAMTELTTELSSELSAGLAEDELAELFGLPEEAGWQERALCAQTDPEAFFPEKGGSTREAKRICTGCEVRGECLEYALSTTSASASGAGCPSASAAGSSVWPARPCQHVVRASSAQQWGRSCRTGPTVSSCVRVLLADEGQDVERVDVDSWVTGRAVVLDDQGVCAVWRSRGRTRCAVVVWCWRWCSRWSGIRCRG